MIANVLRGIATLVTCALAYGVFEWSTPVAGLLGVGELQLVARLGLIFVALGLVDMLAARLLTRAHHNS